MSKFLPLFCLVFSVSLPTALAMQCAQARSAREKLVCATKGLQELDRQMNREYLAALKRTERAPDKMLLKSEQRSWLSLVADACTASSCLENVMKERIGKLKSWNGKPAGENRVLNPQQLESGEDCHPEIKSKKVTLQGGVVSEAVEKGYFCKGAAHPGCDFTVKNSINGKPLPIRSLFKKEIDALALLKKICRAEPTPQDPDNADTWFERCEEIQLDHLGISERGIVVFFDRNGASPCTPVDPVEWKTLRPYLAPNGPVAEARGKELR